MIIKKIVKKIHLWLGMFSGIVVFVSMLAASVFAWEKELTDWYYADKIFVPEVKDNPLSIHVLKANATEIVGNPINWIDIDSDSKRAYIFRNYKKSENPGWFFPSSIEYYNNIYIDQYSGKVLGVVNKKYDWIYNARMLHQCLLLNYDIGHYIVGGSTLIIFIMAITGIVLWWPKNKAALKQRIWFRWKKNTKWRRKNYDLHNIGGIYTFLFILIFATTGLVWTFDWWENGIYKILGSEPDKVWYKPPEPSQTNFQQEAVYDKIFYDATKRVDRWKSISIGIPKKDTASAQKISVSVHYTSRTSGWNEWDNYYYSSHTGKLYDVNTHTQKTLAAKWRNSNYEIHVGNIYGLPTKILASFIALFCASLPVTGFLIWWGRRKKSKSKSLQIVKPQHVRVKEIT